MARAHCIALLLAASPITACVSASDGPGPGEASSAFGTERASCESFLDCKEQHLDEPDFPGRWTCERNACVFQRAPEQSLKPWLPEVGGADCAAEWRAGLSPCDRVKDKYLVVRKSAHNLALCDRGALVKSVRIGLGSGNGDKELEGDLRTPEGVFYIPRKNTVSEFRHSMLLSYPDAEDAERGLRAGKITSGQRDAIVTAQANCAEPPQSTPLGGQIMLHGGGAGFDWTWGCVAVSNPAIDELFAAVRAGDTIVVRP